MIQRAEPHRRQQQAQAAHLAVAAQVAVESKRLLKPVFLPVFKVQGMSHQTGRFRAVGQLDATCAAPPRTSRVVSWV